MLDQVTIKGFQCHRKKVVKLDPGVNTIVGPSDHGKSAIFRAIKWVLTGRPLGDAIINHNKKAVSVSLFTTDGHTVTKMKGKENKYVIDDKEFKAMRSDVPEEVGKVLDIRDICLQSQHDSPFLLSETAGEVGRQLNRYVDLSVVDTLLKKLNGQKREVSKQIEYNQEQLSDWEATLNRYEGLEDALMAAQVLDDAAGRITLDENREREDHDILEAAKEAAQLNTTLPDNLEADFQELQKASDQGKELRREVDALNTLVETIGELEQGIPVDVDQMEIDLMEIRIEDTGIEKLDREVTVFKHIYSKVQSYGLGNMQLTAELLRLEGEYKKLKAKQEVCPTCNRPL